MYECNNASKSAIDYLYIIYMCIVNSSSYPSGSFRFTNTRKKVVFPSIYVEGNVKEIVQYGAKFPSVSEKST